MRWVFNLAIRNDNYNHKHKKAGHKTVLIMTEKENSHIVTGFSSTQADTQQNPGMYVFSYFSQMINCTNFP